MVNPTRALAPTEPINLETENALDCSGIFKIGEDAPCLMRI